MKHRLQEMMKLMVSWMIETENTTANSSMKLAELELEEFSDERKLIDL